LKKNDFMIQENLIWEAPKVITLVSEETEAGASVGQSEGVHHGETHGTVS